MISSLVKKIVDKKHKLTYIKNMSNSYTSVYCLHSGGNYGNNA